VEDLLQLKQEELMQSAALARLSPQYRRLIEMLFLETLFRPYAEVAADSRLEPGSIGFLRQNCLQHLRGRLAEPGFR
jgi:DNA-directed RNA polymerase specialized sigma24 family protein